MFERLGNFYGFASQREWAEILGMLFAHGSTLVL